MSGAALLIQIQAEDLAADEGDFVEGSFSFSRPISILTIILIYAKK